MQLSIYGATSFLLKRRKRRLLLTNFLEFFRGFASLFKDEEKDSIKRVGRLVLLGKGYAVEVIALAGV